MTLTRYRSKGSRLTTEEADDNLDHLSESANHNYTPATGALTDVAHTVKSFLDKLGNAGASLGAALIGFLQDGIGAIARTVSAKLREQVSVLDFIPVASHAGIAAGTNTDDLTSYFEAAVTAASRIYVPPGTYHLNADNLASNTILYGAGEATVLKAYDTGVSLLKALSADATTFITSLVIRDLKLLGTVVADGFQATAVAMLMELGGVKRCRIENVYFEGFRVDGIYLRGNVGASLFHNVDVIIKNCVFDGVNNDNRNGISVIDVDGIEVEGCVFRNCAKSTMPGSLDFEPNESGSVIKNVRVLNNRFYNTDGNRGHIAIQPENTENFANVLIKGNHFEDAGTESAISITTKNSAVATPQSIIIEGNTAFVTGGNFVYKRGGFTDGVVVKGNIARCLRGVWFSGTSVPDDKNISVEGNTFFIEATGTGAVLSEDVSKLAIKNNIINIVSGTHILIGANGASEYVSITGNDFVGTPTARVITHSSTSHGEQTNVLLGNRFELGHTHNFRATRCDYTGSQGNVVNFQTLPSAFAPGAHVGRITAATTGAPGGITHTGTLYTYKQSSISDADIHQEFVPQYSASYRDEKYFRKAVDASNWDSWSVVKPGSVGADVGNASKTLTVDVDETTQVWNTAITADRAVTLSTTGGKNGDEFHITRTAAATGAFNLNVGTGPLKALAAGTWCIVRYNGSAWVLYAYGAL